MGVGEGVSSRMRPQEDTATEGESLLSEEPQGLGIPERKISWRVCVLLCVPVAATGVVLRTWEFICPGASSGGTWDPGTITVPVECLNSAAGWIHLVCAFPLEDLHPAQPQRGAG